MYDELVKSIHCCFGFDSMQTDCENCMMKDKREEHNYVGCCDALGLAAADAIEELQGKHFMMKKTAEWLAEKVPAWVSVADRLPSAHELVLVYNPGYLMTTGFLYEDGRWRVRSVDYPDTPTHWMPLPEPPKEKNHGREI